MQAVAGLRGPAVEGVPRRAPSGGKAQEPSVLPPQTPAFPRNGFFLEHSTLVSAPVFGPGKA